VVLTLALVRFNKDTSAVLVMYDVQKHGSCKTFGTEGRLSFSAFEDLLFDYQVTHRT
jgi:hypothetical protein